MPDFLGTILMLLFWILIVNGISRFFKKMTGADKDKKTPQKQQPQKKQQTFQDIFKELQKKAEEARANQNIPPYAQKEQRKVVEKTNRPPQQEVYTYKESIPEKVKKSDEEFDKFVQEQRRKEHDAEQRDLFKKAYKIPVEEEQEVEPFELDLKNAVLGSIILERPEY